MKKVSSLDSFNRKKKEKNLLSQVNQNKRELGDVEKQIQSWPLELIEAAIQSLKNKN